MKKVGTVGAKQSRKFSEQKLPIGFDLGDRSSWYCVLDEAGKHRSPRLELALGECPLRPPAIAGMQRGV